MSPENIIHDATAPGFTPFESDDRIGKASSLTNGVHEVAEDKTSIGITLTDLKNPVPSQGVAEVLSNGGNECFGDGVPPQPSDLSVAFRKEATFYGNFAHAVLNDEETIDDVESNVEDMDSRYPTIAAEHFERERNKVDVRVKQAMLNMAYTDYRMKNMEKEIKKLRHDVDGLPDDFDAQKGTKKVEYMTILKRSNIQEFQLGEESMTIPSKLKPVLEIQVSELRPSIFSKLKNNTSDYESTGQFAAKEAQGGSSTQSMNRSGSTVTQQSPEKLRVRSRPLLSLLGRISGQELTGRRYSPNDKHPSAVVFLRPFKLFFNHEIEIRRSLQELETRIKKKETETERSTARPPQTRGAKIETADSDDEDLLAELKLLIEFLDVDLKPTFQLRRDIKEGIATSIEYQDLWHLFEVGDDVISSSSRLQAYRVLNFTGGREPLINQTDREEKPMPVDGFVVDCFNLGFDGSLYGPQLNHFSIRRFRGFRPIATLSVYPLRFDASFTALKTDLLTRGIKFLNLTRSSFAHKMLIGTTLDEPVEEIDTQVVIDVTLAINKNPKWHSKLSLDETDLTAADKRETHFRPFCHHSRFSEGCCGSDVAHKDLDLDELRTGTYLRENSQILGLFPADELAEEDRLLLPYWLYGFVLRSRRWITLSVDDLSEVKYENNFDELVLPSGHKDTVKALVRNHAKPSTRAIPTATSNIGAAMDLVRGKGKGLIILLHGEPGVGKTSTAECVADLTQRPLFPITCGDIGETASEVQNSLEYNFQLAHKWGCVLLLDEADVFLAKRNKTDLRRNAVVSVFLRTLEYYSGILFLTTNRVGSIDPAFKSRIHMSLFFPHLGIDATMKLYELQLKRTIEEQRNSTVVDFKVKSRDVLRFAKSHFRRLEKQGLGTWNGRQIRNAFQTAIALAEYDARQPGAEIPSLNRAQFEIIAEASEEFDKYMKNTLGAADADIARREQTRFDKFSNSELSKVAPLLFKERPSWPTRRNAKDPESEGEESSEESGIDDDDSEESDDTRATQRQGKATARSPSAARKAGGIKQTAQDEYEEFLRFQQMKKTMEGKN